MPMKYILLILSLTVILTAKPSDFSIIIDEPFNDALFDVTQDYDRQISAVGFSRDFKAPPQSSDGVYTNAFDYLSSLSNTHGPQTHILKVDNSANITLHKATNLANFNEAVAVVKTPDNGYFVGGNSLDGSLLLLKLDSNGDVLFTRTFGTQNRNSMSKLIHLRDGGVLAVGSSTTSRSTHDPLFESGLGLNDIYLARFSKDGTKLWSKKYGTGYDDRGVDAVEANDGSIIVISQTSYDNNRDITMMRVTQNGNKIWLKHFKSQEIVTPHKIIRLRDNNFLALLSQKNVLNKEQIRLIKFDLQKNILIDKEILTTYDSVLKDIKEYSDSRLIAVGYVKDTYNTDALAMLLDERLSLLAQEHYGGDNNDAFNAVTILHNSEAAAAGIYTNNTSQESNMWLVKLKKDLTLAQISTQTPDFYDELCRIFKVEIDARQLIIQKNLTIQLIDPSLYFKVSEFVLTDVQKIFLDKFSKKLMPFLNANQSYIEALAINGHTSSEWGTTNFTNRYLKNAKLSMNRSYSTLSYIFLKQNRATQTWLTKILVGSGFSYSKKIIVEDEEDRDKSRRVTFKIAVKNEKQ